MKYHTSPSLAQNTKITMQYSISIGKPLSGGLLVRVERHTGTLTDDVST